MIAPRYAPIDTPLGPGFYAYTPGGVVFIANGAERRFLSEATKHLGERPVRHDPPAAFGARVKRGIARGDGSTVDWASIPGFRGTVLQAVARIERGTVQTYGDVARAAGAPRAARAVGTALARNPIPFLIPCHRVVRSDGIGNYGLGGASVKERLLRAEES